MKFRPLVGAPETPISGSATACTTRIYLLWTAEWQKDSELVVCRKERHRACADLIKESSYKVSSLVHMLSIWDWIFVVVYRYTMLFHLLWTRTLKRLLSLVNFAGKWGDWASRAPSRGCTIKLSTTWLSCRGLKSIQNRMLIQISDKIDLHSNFNVLFTHFYPNCLLQFSSLNFP